MSKMSQVEPGVVERYLRAVLKEDVHVLALRHLGEPEEGKGFGYGVPIRVDYESDGGRRESAVLHTMGPGSFGHEAHVGPGSDTTVVAPGVQSPPASRTIAGRWWLPGRAAD